MTTTQKIILVSGLLLVIILVFYFKSKKNIPAEPKVTLGPRVNVATRPGVVTDGN